MKTHQISDSIGWKDTYTLQIVNTDQIINCRGWKFT
jgi:hypothetical protein